MSELFVAANPVEAAIREGDVAAVIKAVRSADRAALAPSLRRLLERITGSRWESTGGPLQTWWGGGGASQDQLAAAEAALFLCGTNADRAKSWLRDDAVLDHLDLLDGASRWRLASDMIEANSRHFRSVQRLVTGGLSERPGSDAYVIALMHAPRGYYHDFRALLAADPGLAEDVVPLLFEVEGTGEINMAAIEKYSKTGQILWSDYLLELAQRGICTRAQLIERTLSTLERDWPQFRAGWFSRFHDKLAPAPLEMAPLAERYLGLCQSRIAPTVTLALQAAAALFKAGHASAAQVLDALVPVATSAIKGQVDAALKLADQVVRQERGMAHAAASLARLALTHEAPEIHKKAIARLAAWGFDEPTRAALDAMLPQVSAANRAALAALIGSQAPVSVAAGSAGAAERAGALDTARRLAPVRDIDELVQLIAQVLEDDTRLDDFERCIDALVRMAPLDADSRPRLHPVQQRIARKSARPGGMNEHPLLQALAGMVAFAVLEQALPMHSKEPASSLLFQRMHDLALFAARHSGLSALDAPTHMGGYLDPAVLAERVAAHAAAGIAPAPRESERAAMRLPSGRAPAAQRDAAFWEWSEGMLRYGASIAPADLEAFFAHGCERLADNIDWWEANWQDKAYLTVLLDPVTPLTGSAVRLLALALGCKEPGQAAMGIDALVAAASDARLDPDRLALEVQAILLSGLGKAARYAKSLAAAARAQDRLPALVCRVLVRVLDLGEAAPPKDTGALLELLLELVLGHGQALTPQARAAIGRIKTSGKGKAAQKQLLAD